MCAQNNRPIGINVAQANRASLKISYQATHKEYFSNKDLKKYLIDWLEKQDSPAEKVLGGKVQELITEIEETNFRNENKLRKWNRELNQ